MQKRDRYITSINFTTTTTKIKSMIEFSSMKIQIFVGAQIFQITSPHFASLRFTSPLVVVEFWENHLLRIWTRMVFKSQSINNTKFTM
jgi:hypothetical protein